MAVTEETFEDALLILASVRAALINRTKHYTKDGRLLGTEKEIMETLLSAGEITVDVNDRLELTTDEEQLRIVQREFEHQRKRYIPNGQAKESDHRHS